MFDPQSIVGEFTGEGEDSKIGVFQVIKCSISYDVELSNLSNQFAYYKLLVCVFDSNNNYHGGMIVDKQTLSACNFLGGNPNIPDDFGPGVVVFDKFDARQNLIQFHISYYAPKFKSIGIYQCKRNIQIGN